MQLINKNTGEIYTGGEMTRNIDEHTVFSGVPTLELLTEWGFEPYIPPTHIPTEIELKKQRMDEILDELKATDYLALKAFEGEDMSEHPGWKEYRAALRVEYRELEEEVKEMAGEENSENIPEE
jgi:hypothetical protein